MENNVHTQEFVVEAEQAGERLDRYLTLIYANQSRSFFQKLIKGGNVSVNGKAVTKAGYVLDVSDVVTASIPEAQSVAIEAEDIPLNILYEDADVLIVDKPKGMVVHPSAGHYSGTLVNAIMYHCADSLSGINGEIRPGIVHRIDMDTTGALIVCKNDTAHTDIAEQIKEHTVTRRAALKKARTSKASANCWDTRIFAQRFRFMCIRLWSTRDRSSRASASFLQQRTKSLFAVKMTVNAAGKWLAARL